MSRRACAAAPLAFMASAGTVPWKHCPPCPPCPPPDPGGVPPGPQSHSPAGPSSGPSGPTRPCQPSLPWLPCPDAPDPSAWRGPGGVANVAHAPARPEPLDDDGDPLAGYAQRCGQDEDLQDDDSDRCCGCDQEDGRTNRTQCFCQECGGAGRDAGVDSLLWRCRWRRRRRRWRRPPEGPQGGPGGQCLGQCPGQCLDQCSDGSGGASAVLWLVCVLAWGSGLLVRSRPAVRPSPRLKTSPSSSTLFWIAPLLLLLASPGCTASAAVSPQTGLALPEGKVCQSVDIRNTVENFDKLNDCAIVEGFVHIALIDNAGVENFTNITFPKLREIHGYLLMYRVKGLRSLSTMFPNLVVIRGYVLMRNYALVIYEMNDLNDIGLVSLMSIKRGSIRIEKNPVLCYVDTVDWSYISHDGEGHYIKGNKNGNECPRKCPDRCPKTSIVSAKATGLRPTTPHLCWTDSHCQKVCPSECGKAGCLDSGQCCSKQCLGGCTGTSSTDCIACKEVKNMNFCAENCPSPMTKYLDRRCVTELECRSMLAPKDSPGDVKYPWRPFNDSCLLECPPGYSEKRIPGGGPGNRDTFTCEKCKGICEKECEAIHVDNIAATQQLKGCTVIKNSLEIQIRGGKNLVKEVEENLKSIREINGYLKIVRSSPLVSLNFLRNLQVIHGNTLDGQYSLSVLDNENLQKLWDWSPNSTFVIKKGHVFFHLNPLLCPQEIEALRNKTGLPELVQGSNGDKVACDMDVLNVTLSKVTSFAGLIVWPPFQTPDPRTLLGYMVHRIEAPYRNVTLYDGRDACGGDGWAVDDITVQGNAHESKTVTHLFTKLEPYTQYAVYVKTYTLPGGSRTVRGAQSDILYFRTLPSIPSTPKDLTAVANSSSEMVIRWKPSYPPNGNVTKYIVQGVMEMDKPDRMDYCDDPLAAKTESVEIIDQIPKTTQAPPGRDAGPDGEHCSCSSKEDIDARKREKETESENELNFEDQLHNMIYIRRPPRDSGGSNDKRKKRTVPRQISDDAYYRYKRSVGQESRFPENPDPPPISHNNNDFKENCTQNICYTVHREVIGDTNFVMRNLHHFSRYSIKVIACRELDSSELARPELAQNCSPAAIIQQRTFHKPSSDTIPKAWLEVNNNTRVYKWHPPIDPNGIIVKYDIQIHTENVETGANRLHCLGRGNTSFVVPHLPSGNYSIHVRATSLFGPGNYTEKSFFVVAEPTNGATQYLYILITFLSVAILGLPIYCYARKRWCPAAVPAIKLISNINPDYHPASYIPDEWEVPRENIKILKELGQGSFGMVYEGIIQNCPRSGIPEQQCAIKTVNENSNDHERIEFLNEASVMKGFNTHHVVRLLGVVSQGQPTLVVMELMARGDLKSYLRKHRPDESDDPEVQPPTLKQTLRMAMEIADGMAYLAAKKFVHRDLAARNCMVADDMTVKIGDFGMTRDVYETDYYRKGTKGLMPVRWMAPESLKDGVFSSATDVWSYGVVLWEMATLASQPYQGLSNEQVLRYVKDGGVMEAPENCPEQLYDLMRRCWHFKKDLRPTFLQLVEMLLPDADTLPSFNARSFYHSPEAHEIKHAPPSGLAPLEEGEMDADIEAISPRTPLRCAVHDIEDFDVDGSESETEQHPEQSGMPAPAPSSYAQYHKAYSSDSSRDSKASNGSSNNVNVNTANGFIRDHWHRHGNGATSHTSHPPHSSHHGPPPTLKTTEC